MTTFLAQNQFISSSAHVPVADGSAVVNASPPSTAAADCIDETCENLKFVYECTDGTMFHRCTTCSRKAYLILPATTEQTNYINEIFFYARKLIADDRQFVLDEAAFMAAIDEVPLFLRAGA